LALQRFLLPDGAARLYLGIADAILFGYYGVATGSFALRIRFE